MYEYTEEELERQREQERERKEKEKKRQTKSRILKVVLVTLLIIPWIGISAFHFSWWSGPEYRYMKAIGAPLENAYDAPDFAVMRDQLKIARQGMVDQGLAPTDCGKAFSWEQTPDWCMAYTYNYLDGLINRSAYYQSQVESGNISTFSDVYNQMMTNMRNEMKRNGPVDWTARPAWYLKNSGINYWGGLVWTGFIVMFIVALVLVFVFWSTYDYDHYHSGTVSPVLATILTTRWAFRSFMAQFSWFCEECKADVKVDKVHFYESYDKLNIEVIFVCGHGTDLYLEKAT